MEIVKKLFNSKKFVASLVATATSLVAIVGWDVDVEKALGAVSPLLVYIGAQGFADIGKGKAEAEKQS